MSDKLLEVKDLRTSFFTHLGEVKAIRGISFDVEKGESIGIVGESGSGKSVTSLSIMKLLLYPGKIVGGEILFNGEDLVNKTNKDMMAIRGNEIAMIFQDPMTSLNPVYTIGDQIAEAIIKHQKLSRKEAHERALEMLKLVNIPDPEKRIHNFPHEFSGGMRQRAMIAIALSCQPQLLIADEPTTALDVTIQAQILDLMKSLNAKLDTSTMLITHDLGVVADVCSRVVVMYGGLIMEKGSIRDIYYEPRHPYTMGLLKSIPKVASDEKQRLIPIPGTPPDLLNPPTGCPFYARCEYAMRICNTQQPPYFKSEDGKHESMCWLLHPDAPINEKYELLKGGVKVGK
ncbi:ABC transporter ATP-binding protein [Sedimentibacter saalensis]|jgi:oligopeptide transport system ATP-binding protein|uniref:Oligopeptide transport system ATP-binding protein n=1 Tax=Sedimentibacter saalensis TaxID=130788 RepID=A0A562J9G9_9FIRM|nr:ABC transporter ATP-binding protein [Sedimentibacter saalensis]MEA5095710.1 ABC transporter ATP-binding protein [Sedimentibacter saalensis]TWH79767.1 oligopeptide transport system ATP-binding protein [Sedimentibacter saalensis]